MNKLHTQTESILRSSLFAIGVVYAIFQADVFAKKPERDIWVTHENLTNRLSSEWFKMGVLSNDLESIRDILNDLRDVEIFPSNVTKLSENQLIAFDKSIEKTEKQLQSLVDELSELRIPLSDAIAILREMVIGKPVEDMFEVIEQGDMQRIAQLLLLKHKIDVLWKDVDQLLERINTDMGLKPFAGDTSYGIEKDFFTIIKAILGQQSDDYYNKLNSLKNGLIARAGSAEITQMYKIELLRLKKSLASNKVGIVQRKIVPMRERYKGSGRHELNILLARVNFMLGEYTAATETIDLLPQEPQYTAERALCKVQSWYALQEFDTIWQWSAAFDFSSLVGGNKNLLLWLVMESGMALNKRIDYAVYAEQMEPVASYRLHILHALARAYLQQNQPQIALSIFKKALEREPELPIDINAYNRILLDQAQTFFDLKDYRNSLDAFFVILNKGIYFEEALFGIAWCYVNLNMYQKAEITLRKLINQSPQSYRAAEAILVMAKRYIAKARYEWSKTTYLIKEQNRLEDGIKKLNGRIKATKDKAQINKFKTALEEIKKLDAQLIEKPRSDYSQIKELYTQALLICNLITKHYTTGSFQEISFSEKREKILHQLDSLILSGEQEKKAAVFPHLVSEPVKQQIVSIKKVVDESYIINAEINLSIYRWEKEYIDWSKMLLYESEKDLRASAQSARDSAQKFHFGSEEKKVAASIDSLIIEEAALHKRWYDTLQTRLSRLAETPLDSADAAYLRYHLGELHYLFENRKYSEVYERYEKNAARYDSSMTLFHNGTLLEMPLEPEQPVLDHSSSIEQFTSIILRYNHSEWFAAACYSLAWCYTDLGKIDSAVAYMSQVALNYPHSPYHAQAWMYLGEYYFDNASLDSAIAAYKNVMKHPESDWFDEALYKLAWTQYRLSNPEKAISSFLALVDLGKEEKTGKAMLESESMDYIAISFSESDLEGDKGLSRAKAFVKKLGNTEKATQILHRLASVYEEQGRYEIARKAYSDLLASYPDYEQNPVVETRLLNVMARGASTQEANDQKIGFFKKYNRKGNWALRQKNTKVIARADSIAERQLYDASMTYHQLALQHNDTALYAKAASNYRTFIHFYPTSPQANECHYNLAEILFSTGRYLQAAKEYMAVSKRYPDSKYRETAAWNAIVASQNLMKEEAEKRTE